MSDIKWNQCPEATHYRPYDGMYKWYRERNGKFAFLNECGDWEASSVDTDSLRRSLIWKASESSWIKCSDRLPDDGVPVIGSGWNFRDPTKGRWVEPTIYSKEDSDFHPVTNDGLGNLVSDFDGSMEPTHWQPLPAPPTD